MLQETLRVLKLRCVPGVGVDKQQGVRDVARHVERVDRWDHHVVHPIQDEGRLFDVTQVGERIVFR